MPALQTQFPGTIRRALLGMIANQELWNAISGTAKGATLAFGVPVAQGASEEEVTIYDAGSDRFLGISIRENILARREGQTVDVYQIDDSVAILTQGTIWVMAGASVTAGQAARFNTGTGKWVATGGTPVPGCEFDIAAGPDELVRLRVQRPAGLGVSATNPTVVGISVIPNNRVMGHSNGDEFTLQVDALRSDGSSVTLVNNTVSFASSDAGKATVSVNGLVDTVAVGTTTITATYQGFTDTCAITVVA